MVTFTGEPALLKAVLTYERVIPNPNDMSSFAVEVLKVERAIVKLATFVDVTRAFYTSYD